MDNEKAEVYAKGDYILVIDRKSGGTLNAGIVTYRSVEKGRTVYDYTNTVGNPSWCYDTDVLCRLRKAEEGEANSG